MEAVLRAIDTSTDAGARDFVLTLFLNETGARLNETLSVRMRDIHADGKGKVTVTVTGKGGYVRTLYLTPVLTRKLKEYILRVHGESPNPEAYLFFSKIKGLNTKITARAVQKRMKELAAKAHEDCEEVPLDLHPHNYRHAYGTKESQTRKATRRGAEGDGAQEHTIHYDLHRHQQHDRAGAGGCGERRGKENQTYMDRRR